MSKSVGTGPSSCEKRIYRAAVSQSLGNTGLDQKSVNLRSKERSVRPAGRPTAFSLTSRGMFARNIVFIRTLAS